MAHYDIFRDQLAIRYPAYGHALWEPSPGTLYPAVEVGDVGFIREGRFHRLFNALLPADHPSHANLGVPESYQPLTTPGVVVHTDSLPLGAQDFCSRGVIAATELEVFAAAPAEPGQISFSCTKKQGAVLCLPVQAQRNDTLVRGVFQDYIVRNIDRWFAFSRTRGLGVNHMEEIILVTGRDRTRSCTNIVFSDSEGQAGTSVSFGVEVRDLQGHVGIQWNFTHQHAFGAVMNPGQSGTDLPEDQCIFIRGLRVTRTLMILRRLRGAAGPSNLDEYDPEPEPQAMFVSPVPKYRDPLQGLLEYLAEQAPECDMVLVHDDDLGSVKGTMGDSTSLETLQADVVKGHLQNLKPEITRVSYDWSSSNESSPNTNTGALRVAMLSSESPGSVSVPCNANAFDTLNIDNPTNQTATSLQTSPGGPGIAVPPERRGESDLSLSDSTQSTQLAYSSQPPAPYTFPYGDDLVQPLGRDQRTDQQGIVSHLNFPLQAATLEGLLSSRLTSPTPPRVRWFTAQCSLPDCMNPAFFDQTEQEQRDYCLEHISFALSSGFAAPCQRCGRLPARLASSFCGKGCDGAQLLRQVPHRQAAAKDVLTTGRPDVSSDVGTYYEGLFIHDSWG